MENDIRCRSWFCVFNNPEEHGIVGEPQKIVDKMVDIWISDNPQRTCAVIYCVSADGLKHCHAVFEDTKVMRFSAIKKLFPSMHIEPTKGNKEQAEDYINKKGKWEEKGEIIVCSARHGEIKGCQGQRRDFDIIDDLLSQGKTPDEILAMSFSYYRYDQMIKKAYYSLRKKNTPDERELIVYWHVGASGSGKSYTHIKLIEKYGSDNLYFVNDYDNGFDKYNGESILFMDEFTGQMRFNLFKTITDKYKAQVPCRYSNIYALWNEIHITSILPPEFVYENMVQNYKAYDSYEQLRRRIHYVVYHWIDEDGKYQEYMLHRDEYTNYADLIRLAMDSLNDDIDLIDINIFDFDKCKS